MVSDTFPGTDTTVSTTPIPVSVDIGLGEGGHLRPATIYCVDVAAWNSVTGEGSPLLHWPITTFSTLPLPVVAPTNTRRPDIRGQAKSKKILTATHGNWTGTPPLSYSYQWEVCNKKGRGCHAVRGAKRATFTLSKKNIGERLEAVVTASNAAGTARAISKATAVIQR